METIKRADDLPNHALSVMRATLDMCADIFPSIQRKDLADTFVAAYFSQGAKDADK